MKLTYFSIQDYRSIRKAELEELQTATILIGPNNEGKSNVLHSLNTCLTLLRSERILRSGGKVRLRFDRESYDWNVDYPVRKQTSSPDGESVFQLHFQLSEKEQADFHAATGSKLNGVLPIELSFGTTVYAAFKVLKQGKGGAALSRKPEQICKFISSRLDYVYVPAVRTADASISLVNELVRRELRQQLADNPRYEKLQAELAELHRPVVEEISAKLKENLRGFLGINLKSVTVTLSERYRSAAYNKSCQITIDDGTPTVLERKGDGVQSLVALSLMTGALRESKAGKDLILLIEEPESHLHPKAIHQLREVLDELRQENQLIVTTHCPLLVNRANVGANFLISKSKASPAKSLAELRRTLGVRTSDNLEHAALVLVVEGSEDEVSLRGLLPHYSRTVGNALSKGSLAFHVLGGASKLPYALSLLQSSLCNYISFIDDDQEGRKAYAEAAKSLLASTANTITTKCVGLPESEFEDLVRPDLYADYFRTRYSVDVTRRPFDQKLKWSGRIFHGLEKLGKASPGGEVWPEVEKCADKRAIADMVAKHPGIAIHPAREEVIKGLASTLEDKLAALAAGGKA